MFRISLIVLLVSAIVGLQSACAVGSDAGQGTTTADQSKFIGHIGGGGLEARLSNFDESDVKELVHNLADRVRLNSLSKNARRDGFELRLWTSFSIPWEEKLLIVRMKSGANQAFFYRFGRAEEKSDGVQKLRLADPKDGWNALQAELSNRLAVPKPMVVDPWFFLDRDEGLNALEVVEKGEYRVAFYEQQSSFEDAIRVVELCRYLSEQFDIDPDCRGERNRLRPIR